jgi:hypothetical protein
MVAKLTRLTHKNSSTTAPNDREVYHLELSLQAASPETFGYTFVNCFIVTVSSHKCFHFFTFLWLFLDAFHCKHQVIFLGKLRPSWCGFILPSSKLSVFKAISVSLNGKCWKAGRGWNQFTDTDVCGPRVVYNYCPPLYAAQGHGKQVEGSVRRDGARTTAPCGLCCPIVTNPRSIYTQDGIVLQRPVILVGGGGCWAVGSRHRSVACTCECRNANSTRLEETQTFK